ALLLCCLLPALAPAAKSDDLLGQLKVAYIYNFTRFIDWPAAPHGRPFVIGVIGDPDTAERLRLLDGRQAEGRTIEIRRYAGVEDVEPSEMLFVGAAAEPELAAIVQRTAGAPTVLVGDTPGYAGRGIAIEFFLKPDVFGDKQRLRFRIDPKALHGRGLKVSAQLLDVAEVLP
ncbi:MAG: hypothetical protein RLZ44_1608, partial [Pseudomonadota bacterium]